MKKQLFLHVGMGKTGTTALQEFFFANRAALAQVGVAYPEIGVEAGAHHRLSAHVPAELAPTGWEFLAPHQWVDAVLACPQDRILLSSELNSWATREEVAAFVAALTPHVDLQIVYYLRRPDNFVMADYNQQVKAGIEARSLADALPEITRRADFPRKIAFWADLLGDAAMHLRIYERAAFKGGDIITDFLEEVLGIADTGFVRVLGENSNPRLTPEVLGYKRLLNSALPDMRDSGHFIAPLAAFAAAQDAGARGIYQDQALLDGAARQAIIDHYAPAMADVARRYFGRADGVLFAEPLVAKPAAVIRPMPEVAAQISVWLAAHHPVETAFLRAQLADVLGANLNRGDLEAARILAASFADAEPVSAPVAAEGLLVPARKWDALRAEYAAQIDGLREGLQGAEAARDALLEQLGALSKQTERSAKEAAAEAERSVSALNAELAAQADAYSREIEALKAGLAGAEETALSLRAQITDLQAEQARIIGDFEAQAARVGGEFATSIADYSAQIEKLKSDNEFFANEVSVARHAAKLASTERDQLARDLAAQAEILRQMQAREAELLASTSWRVTAPLRSLGMGLRRAKSVPRTGWLALNREAQSGYRALARRHPKAADHVKRALWPLLMAGNRSILKSNHLPMNLQERAIKGPVTKLDFQRARARAPYAPLVSIIVPNYNHAPYLAQRLESIYAQTYANVEVLLMDDCSTDDSRAVLQGFADRFLDRTRVLFNETNSGGVFFQWEKGLREAKGDLIWIAESDDWASDNFLAELVPFFENQAVQLAYAPTVFMNGTGDEQVWSMDHCLAGLNPERWHQPFVETAPRIVAQAFGERNIVPNVSSAMFRKVDRLDVLENDLWRKMRTCGDWLFYINLIRGGCIAFSPEATNYYRLHDNNTSRTSYAKDSFYEEHEVIAKALQRHYDVPWDVFERQDAALRDHWQRNRPDWDEAAFEACYSLDRIRAERAARKPNLLMVGFAFCAGGGETFPIQLANLMKTAGYNVTFLDCAQEAEVPGIRAMLARDIPVVSNFEGLAHIAQVFDIDVIHSHHAWVDNTILDVLPQDAKAKTVVSLHGMYETIPEGDLKRILPRLVARTGKLIYTAEKNLGALLAHGLVQKGEIDRIDNALDRRPVTPIDRAELGIAREAFVLTLVARALEDKGWFEAVEAVERARRASGADIHLILIGEGPAYDKLRAKGVADFVHLLGFKSNIRDYFAASDMGFLPSRYKGESFPLVLIDCLNAGRPVLASTVGEIRYMLETEAGPAGALFDLKDWKIDVAALAAQIGTLASDPAAMAALVDRVPAAAARFDPILMRDRYDAAYHAAMASAPLGADAEEEHDV